MSAGGAEHFTVELPDENATARLGEDIASALISGDMVALSGELGTGKTVLARAIVRALAGDPELVVTSPTYALRIDYPFDRLAIAHADLFRLTAEESDELGLDEAVSGGALIVEWPDRLKRLPEACLLQIDLSDGEGHRRAEIVAHGSWPARFRRARLARDFLASAAWPDAARTPIVGDASSKAFERIGEDGKTAVLMNAAEHEAGSAGPDDYDTAAKRASGVGPFLALAAELRKRGVHAPKVLAADVEVGLALLEDLGAETLVGADGGPVLERYEAAIDLLLFMHGEPWPEIACAADNSFRHQLPEYDLDALLIEVSLFVDWYAGRLGRPAMDATARRDFLAAWHPLAASVCGGNSGFAPTWVLRDYHSPNLLWLADAVGLDRLGVIDFQDALWGHPAYDVASLAQDVRISISPDQEIRLKTRYIEGRAKLDPEFDPVAFESAYAIVGAQRVTKVLGAFSRLAEIGGKPGYLAHIDRARDILRRNLAHPVLSSLGLWYAPYV